MAIHAKLIYFKISNYHNIVLQTFYITEQSQHQKFSPGKEAVGQDSELCPFLLCSEISELVYLVSGGVWGVLFASGSFLFHAVQVFT